MFLLDFSGNTFRVTNTNLKYGDRVRAIKGFFIGIDFDILRYIYTNLEFDSRFV
jgi:hypothetical protein